MDIGMGMVDEGNKVVEVFMPLMIDTDFQSTYNIEIAELQLRDEEMNPLIG